MTAYETGQELLAETCRDSQARRRVAAHRAGSANHDDMGGTTLTRQRIDHELDRASWEAA